MSKKPTGKRRAASATTKKASKTSKKTATKTSKKGAAKASGDDAKAFFDLLHTDESLKDKLRKGWFDVLKSAKQRGFDFDPRELYQHFVKKYGIKNPAPNDSPDTCICVCL